MSGEVEGVLDLGGERAEEELPRPFDTAPLGGAFVILFCTCEGDIAAFWALF